MARDIAVAEALYQHVLGTGDPSGCLVDAGTFPAGWADEYRRLLGLAKVEWLEERLWPRCLAVALYYVVTHLEVRYQAWCATKGGERRNEDTEHDIAAVAGPTRIFFAHGFSLARRDQA